MHFLASVQDACLITMLRISAVSDEVPSEVTELIKDLHTSSGRHLKRVSVEYLLTTNLTTSNEAMRAIHKFITVQR